MSRQATGSYTITSWDEKTWDGKPWNEVPGSKVTHSKVRQTFSGGIEGQAICQQLVAYSSDTYASFVGLHQVTGSVEGRSGSFVLQSSGIYTDNTARVTWFVVPGSGTGELAGLSGQGSYTAGQEEYPNVPYTLEYQFEDQASVSS
jgi:Protein of unknown function (DUF3224)